MNNKTPLDTAWEIMRQAIEGAERDFEMHLYGRVDTDDDIVYMLHFYNLNDMMLLEHSISSNFIRYSHDAAIANYARIYLYPLFDRGLAKMGSQ
jgi:hypothetical protein